MSVLLNAFVPSARRAVGRQTRLSAVSGAYLDGRLRGLLEGVLLVTVFAVSTGAVLMLRAHLALGY